MLWSATAGLVQNRSSDPMHSENAPTGQSLPEETLGVSASLACATDPSPIWSWYRQKSDLPPSRGVDEECRWAGARARCLHHPKSTAFTASVLLGQSAQPVLLQNWTALPQGRPSLTSNTGFLTLKKQLRKSCPEEPPHNRGRLTHFNRTRFHWDFSRR